MAGQPVQSRQDETLTHVFLTNLVGVFLNQNYPKYTSDVVSKILEKKNTNIRCFVWIWDLPEIAFPVVKVKNLYYQFFSCFTEPILAGPNNPPAPNCFILAWALFSRWRLASVQRLLGFQHWGLVLRWVDFECYLWDLGTILALMAPYFRFFVSRAAI